MQATVALVEARPETILEDVRRALDLSGLGPDFAAGTPVLVSGRRGGGWFPGAASTPWQLEGALGWLCAQGAPTGPFSVLTLDVPAGELAVPPSGRAWSEVLDRFGAQAASPRDWQPAPVHPATPMPSLAAALQGVPACPAPLQGRPTLLLPTARWCADWPLAGACELVGALFGPRRRQAGVPVGEVRAEAVALARQILPGSGVLMDATVWGICRGHGLDPVARNVLIAGTDPVAVDVVAARLIDCGERPARWAELCERRKLGCASVDRIRVVGSTELLQLDFRIPEDTLGAPGTGPDGRSPGAWLWRTLHRRRRLAAFGRTAWGRLYEDYRTGRVHGEGR